MGGLTITNLILAIIVDKAASVREESLTELLQEKENTYKKHMARLKDCWDELDKYKTGTLSRGEIQTAYESNPGFRATLEAMDIDKQDVSTVFDIIPACESGHVSYDEFVNETYNMKYTDARTKLSFIQVYVAEIRNKILEQLSTSRTGNGVGRLQRVLTREIEVLEAEEQQQEGSSHHQKESWEPELWQQHLDTDMSMLEQPVDTRIVETHQAKNLSPGAGVRMSLAKRSSESGAEFQRLLQVHQELLTAMNRVGLLAEKCSVSETEFNRLFQSNQDLLTAMNRVGGEVTHLVDSLPKLLGNVSLEPNDCSPQRSLPLGGARLLGNTSLHAKDSSPRRSLPLGGGRQCSGM